MNGDRSLEEMETFIRSFVCHDCAALAPSDACLRGADLVGDLGKKCQEARAILQYACPVPSAPGEARLDAHRQIRNLFITCAADLRDIDTLDELELQASEFKRIVAAHLENLYARICRVIDGATTSKKDPP